MKRTIELFTSASTLLLILLWVYAASSKLLSFGLFQAQMRNQALPLFLRESLAYFLPPLEFILAALLVIPRWRLAGFYLSLITLLCFDFYVGMVITGRLGNAPCSCGGIISLLSWKEHFLFNCFFIILIIISLCLQRRERSSNSEG